MNYQDRNLPHDRNEHGNDDDDPAVIEAHAWIDSIVSRAKTEGRVIYFGSDLTPARAQALLDRNPENRSLRQKSLDAYKADIHDENWLENGETVIVADDGLLNDGQHRCLAVRTTGRTIRTGFAIGASRHSRLTVDQGRSKTVGDYLGMDGATNGNQIAAVAALAYQYDNYGTVHRNTYPYAPTKTQMMEYIAEHGDSLISSYYFVRRFRSTKRLGARTAIAFCHYVFKRKNEPAANEFIASFMDGTGLFSGDPIYVLRERFLRDVKITRPERIELMFRTWNSWRLNRPTSRAQLGHGLPDLEG